MIIDCVANISKYPKSIIWITQTERTASMPIVVGNKIYISGGIGGGFGSRPKVEAYQDNGQSVVKLWETPESMIIGGWTHQPAYSSGRLYAGKIPGGDYYNMNYSEGLPGEHLDDIKVLLEKKIPIRNIVIGLDNFSYIMRPDDHRGQIMRHPYDLSFFERVFR